MNRNNILKVLIGIILIWITDAGAESMSKQKYLRLRHAISIQHKDSITVCDDINWNEGDVCLAEADAKEMVDNAELYAEYRPSSKSRHQAVVIRAESNYAIALAKCNGELRENRQNCWRVAKTIQQRDIENSDTF
jgi:hypothetical protein